MASLSAEYDDPHFTGQSAEEAEDFIQAVNKRAYAAGKQKDNTWIAEFAYPFFSGKALRWYDSLDEGTQNDWRLLRSAILAQFTEEQLAPSTVPSAAPAVSSSSSRYTPAAPPPLPRTKLLGRIRVDSQEPSARGYLAIRGPGVASVCKDINEANIFEVDTLGQTLTVKGVMETIAIKGSQPAQSLSIGTDNHGLIASSSKSLGPQWSTAWFISGDDNKVVSSLRADGRQFSAHFCVHKSAVTKYIFVPADPDRFLAQYPTYEFATLLFEQLS